MKRIIIKMEKQFKINEKELCASENVALRKSVCIFIMSENDFCL